ncbi:hypothetical protein F4819DRAFT_483812 [Hypoxylon fuscum]|nr:hypothetical protein F4819DRAFT_483812 [Hypoxylon fuscum]
MSNYDDMMTLWMQQMASDESDDKITIKATYVTAAQYGKSTKLVPDMWDYLQLLRSRPQGLYVQSLPIQSHLLSSHLAGSGVKTLVEQVPRGDEKAKLGLLSYDSWQRTLRDDQSRSSLEYQNMVLFLDVEQAPTVEGELSIALLVQWIKRVMNRERSRGGEINIAIVLLSQDLRLDVLGVFERFINVTPRQFSWEERMGVEMKGISDEDLTDIQNLLHNVFLDDNHAVDVHANTPGPFIVILASYELRFDLVQPLFEKTDKIFELRCLTKNSSVPEILGVMRHNGRCLIFVEPSFDISLPIRNLRYVISLEWKSVGSWDHATSQFLLNNAMCISSADHNTHLGWVIKGLPFVNERPMLTARWTEEFLLEYKSSDIAPLYGQMMRLCLEASRDFPNLLRNRAEVPIPVLYHIDQKIDEEVLRRLHLMGCLHYNGPGNDVVSTALGARTLFYTQHGSLNPDGDIHQGNLIARIETYTTLSMPVRRVLIRIAALTGREKLCHTSSRLVNDDPESLVALRDDSAGVGRQYAGTGEIWTLLGIWLKMRQEDGPARIVLNPVGSERSYVPWGARGLLRINIQVARKALARIESLEKRLGMSPCLDEVKETQLSEDERCLVLEILLRAYLTRLIVFPCNSPDRHPHDVVSKQPVDVSREYHPIAFSHILRGMRGQPGGLCAIYQMSYLLDGGIVPHRLTLIPRSILRKVQDELGGGNLGSVLASDFDNDNQGLPAIEV